MFILHFYTFHNRTQLIIGFYLNIAEMECLAKHGILLPPNMQGLTDDQIVELKLKDEWAEKYCAKVKYLVKTPGFHLFWLDVGVYPVEVPHSAKTILVGEMARHLVLRCRMF